MSDYLPPELWTENKRKFIDLINDAIHGPKKVFSDDIGDATIIAVAVPAEWGLNADIILTVFYILVGWFVLSILFALSYYIITHPIFRYEDKDTWAEKIEQDRSLKEESDYWDEYNKRKKEAFRTDTMEMRRREDARMVKKFMRLFKSDKGSIKREE